MRSGLGKADITGPIAGVRFFGYGNLAQVGAGLEQRQYARAFIVEAEQPAVFVVADLGMMSELVRARVLVRVEERFAGRYPPSSICLTATHTHSAPGGYASSSLYSATILGHSPRYLDRIVEGIVEAIAQADDDLAPGSVRLTGGPLLDASVNRSILAFEANPAAERAAAGHPFNHRMVQLSFRAADGRPRGLLNWFAVHGTNYDKHHVLVGGDNKGIASWSAEHRIGDGFVAAFAQANAGDISPNRRPTDDGRLEGEGDTPRESARIIGERQARRALELFEAEGVEVGGPIEVSLGHVDFDAEIVPAGFSSTGRDAPLGPALLGQGFLAGTRDGRGVTWMEEGTTEANLLVSLFARATGSVDATTAAVHGAKVPVLRLSRPSSRLVPSVLPLQLLRVGPLAVAAIPFETSTLAGARIQHDVCARMASVGVEEAVVGTFCNAYCGYLVTPEEYDVQLYEASSTLFGRQQLDGVRARLDQLARSTSDAGSPPAWAPAPRLEAMRPAFKNLDRPPRDAVPRLRWFGHVIEDCLSRYAPRELASARFWSADFGGRLIGADSLFDVERKLDGAWTRVADDHHPDTRVYLERHRSFWRCTCEWRIPPDVAPGLYRLVHRGVAHRFDGVEAPYEGTSRSFEVVRLGVSPTRELEPTQMSWLTGVSSDQVAAVIAASTVATVAAGDRLAAQGAEERDLICLLSGRARVARDGLEVTRVGPGELLGEQALFDGAPRGAEISMVEAGRCLRLDREAYERLAAAGNEAAFNLEREAITTLARRLDRVHFILDRLAGAAAKPGWRGRSALAERWSRWWASGRGAGAPRSVFPADALARNPAFAETPEDALGRIGAWFEPVALERGEVLFEEGEVADTLIVVGDGQVDLLSADAGAKARRRLARAGPADLFGVSALAGRRFRTASAVAATSLTAFAVDPSQRLGTLSPDDPDASQFRRAMIRALSAQLRSATARLLELDLDSREIVEEISQRRAGFELSFAAGAPT